LGARDAWLGFPDTICDLRSCPSIGDNYRYFDGTCSGEEFQKIGEGYMSNPGQRIQLRYIHEFNTWLGCDIYESVTGCYKNKSSGTTAQGQDFNNNRCWGEIFIIYARGRANGAVIYNGDVIILVPEYM